ncbi:CBS domain-containing protein [Amycolatopsis sp. NPDC059021]|uniref:CBS domain-containing protein n=1 Tax=Amycolatopsis sp. NPDC059021 TaxID=3346704 RepID=UPI003671C7A6
MRQNVSDVMTANPVTVTPRTPYKHVARLLTERRISAVPVLDAHDRPLGVVSEADLLARFRTGTGEARPGLISGGRARRDWDKAHALVAEDLMTRPARTITVDASVQTAAIRLARTGIRRLFVVDDGRLVGVVSRRDLLGSFCRPDPEIHADIERDVLQRALWATPGQAAVTVENGVVTLVGRLDSRGEAERAGLLTARVPGVIDVHNRLDFVWDDQAEPHLQPSTSDK